LHAPPRRLRPAPQQGSTRGDRYERGQERGRDRRQLGGQPAVVVIAGALAAFSTIETASWSSHRERAYASARMVSSSVLAATARIDRVNVANAASSWAAPR
jgi:hypothetical protein